MNWMHTDVAELQNGLEGPATRYAELMVQLVTSAPRVKRVVEAGEEAPAVMSRQQAMGARGASGTTNTAQRFRCKEATDHKSHVWSGEKNSESFTAFKVKLQKWVGSQHDHMM